MTLAEATALIMILGLTAYAVLGGADFGVGIWDLTAGVGKRGSEIRSQISRSMGPVWEANHVWLIFVLVVCWTAFPVAFASIMSSLYIPLFAAAIGIILRGGAWAFREPARRAWIDRAFAVSSIVTPFFLGAAVGAVASGRVPEGNAVGDPLTSWLNPTSILAGTIAVITGAFLAAVFLTADARKDGDEDLAARFQLRALISGIAAGALAMGGLFVLRDDAPVIFDGLTEFPGLGLVLASATAGVVSLALLAYRHYELSRVAAALAVAAIVIGWGVAQSPQLLVGELTIAEASASSTTLVALLVSIAVGLVVLLPALGLLAYFTLTRRLSPPPY